ncbi:MAG TPA: hypothetical protein DHW49_00775 [Anaerolineae bacterium]|nr:hypothetical protein [Anaerolineae bacterium]
MKLIERYVSEVGKNLPLIKGREDIEKELRSTLEDMLEERAEKAGRPVDEAMEIELLKEYGSPNKVAMTYNPQPYLIGPRMFPFFLTVLKIVIPIVVIVLLVLTGIQAVTETPLMGREFINIIGDGLAGIVSAAITATGYIIVIFAILERVLPDSEIDDLKTDEDWNPASLTENDPDTVKRGDLIAEIAFTFVGLAILNLYPEILGMSFFSDGDFFFVPMFSDIFLKFVPWINAIFLIEIVLDIYLLRKAIWTIGTRIVNIILSVASLTLAVVFIRTTDIIGFTAESFANSPFTPEQAEKFITIANVAFSISLIVVIVIVSIELIKAVIGLVRSLNKK